MIPLKTSDLKLLSVVVVFVSVSLAVTVAVDSDDNDDILALTRSLTSALGVIPVELGDAFNGLFMFTFNSVRL